MKTTVLFLILGTRAGFAGNSYSEATHLSIEVTNMRIKDVFREIENRSEYIFFYYDGILDVDRKVDVHMKNRTVDKILDRIFEGTDNAYVIHDRQIFITSRKTPVDATVDATVRQQQGRRIAGTVADAAGEAIIGANIIERGSTNGAVTDVDGRFALTVGSNAILQVSFIGYVSREIIVGNQTDIGITLQEDNQALEEVVVVGYGTQKKANLTGAVTSVNGEKMARRPVSSTTSMLQGMMSGVQISQGSGEPGADDVLIQIRGKGTFSSAGSNPLVLINGIPGNIENVNAYDIESVSVLKDAASAAIYGSQAANGVILITTKSGSAGKTNISVRASYAMKYPTFLWKLITNSAEYMELYNEASINSGISDPGILYTRETIEAYRNATDRTRYPDTDWLDELFDPSPTQNYYLNINGGNEKTQYNLSADIVSDDGIMKGYNYEKVNAMLSLTSQIHEKITLNAIVTLNTSEKTGTVSGGQDQVISALAQSPLYGPKLWDGSGRYTQKAFTWEYVNKNPIAQIEKRATKNNTYSAYSQVGLDVQLLENLLWSSKGGINTDFKKYNYFAYAIDLYNFNTLERVSKGTTGGSTREFSQNAYFNLQSWLAYDKRFDDSHNIRAQLGYSMEGNNYEFVRGGRRNYDIELLTEINAGSVEIQSASGNRDDWALMSYFGRLNYNYKERYLLEAVFRYDGSSRLSPDSRWGLFPSFSAGWRVSEENFMNPEWLNNLKVRASWGQLGNQNIGLYPYQALISLSSYPFDNASYSTTAAQIDLNNSNIRWETTTQMDIGLDITVFDHLSLTFDWFKKRTSDILRGSQVTGIVGLTPPTVNNGVMDNTGLELELVYNGQVKSGVFDGLNYSVGANLDHYRNRLVKFGQREIGEYSIRQEGEEWDAFYGLKWIGIFQSQQEIDNSPKQFNDATVPGDLKWEDTNGDGVVNNDDRAVIPGRYPKLNYGLNLSANWKSFDFYTLFQGVYGVKFFLERWGIIPFSQGSPPTVQWRERWTEENPSTTMPRMYYAGWESAPDRIRRPSSWFVRDGSYFRLKNISLGYTIPPALSHRLRLNRTRIYLSGDNLFTITRHRDLDPERNSSGYNANYTQNRVLSIGLDIQF
ncbi:MAG: TonB-dependent receptor [Tannerella sp.]|jgi:TonB-linked SusC/RagA family outer membrane protein|nr:TonB-dependent receptor [Tannerella sp.]